MTTRKKTEPEQPIDEDLLLDEGRIEEGLPVITRPSGLHIEGPFPDDWPIRSLGTNIFALLTPDKHLILEVDLNRRFGLTVKHNSWRIAQTYPVGVELHLPFQLKREDFPVAMVMTVYERCICLICKKKIKYQDAFCRHPMICSEDCYSEWCWEEEQRKKEEGQSNESKKAGDH